jgi:ketosteroid isomerase-like protein
MKCKGIFIVLCTITLISCSSALAQTPEELIDIRNAYAAALDNQDLDAMFSFWAEDGVYDYVQSPPPMEGKAVIKAAFDEFIFAMYPDMHTDEGIVLAAGNIVVVQHNSIATYLDTGIEVIGPHLDIYEFEGDKIKKATTYADSAGEMIQLGAMPAPEMPELVPSFTLPDPEPTGLSPVEADIEEIARYNGDDIAHYAKMFRSDAQLFVGPLGTIVDRNEWIAIVEMLRGGFSDGITEVVRRIDLGDGWILGETRMRSRHTGTYLGIPGSGYMIDMRSAYLSHFDADGLITHHNMYWDNLTLITQMTTPPFPLDGIWISTVPTPLGNLILTTTYVAQDAAKTRYSGSVVEINPMPLLADIYPDADQPAKWAGAQAEMVARNKYEATLLGYETRTVETDIGKTVEFVGLFTIKAYFELLGPDQLAGYGTGSYYLASQDADQDGFPDEGEEPVACIPWEWTGKRLTALPGCVLVPGQ